MEQVTKDFDTMSGDFEEVPVLDFSSFSLDINEEEACFESVESLAADICNVFKTVGFVYLKNSGITQSEIDDMHNLARSFFSLSQDTKKKYERRSKDVSQHYGWLSVEAEHLNAGRPSCLKESLDIQPQMDLWPDEVLHFESKIRHFYQLCHILACRIMYLIGVGLKVKDPNVFRNSHNPNKNANPTFLRLLHYPAVPQEDYKPNQIWCGEHSDFGAITLLFQDDVGGLQVKNKRGQYIPAKPIPDTIVINVGDMLQHWTSDTLKSTWHRVVAPDKVITRDRISITYFTHPDEETLIECVDGSNTYAPMVAKDYMKMLYDRIYAKFDK